VGARRGSEDRRSALIGAQMMAQPARNQALE
jgi:hypothetical protein